MSAPILTIFGHRYRRTTEIPPAGMRFDVPARHQGQIVEYAYGVFKCAAQAGPGDPWLRVTDTGEGGGVEHYRLISGGAS